MATVALNNVTLGYDGHPAVHHLSGVFPSGGLVAIVGPNGSGKSTLLKGLMGELKPMGGRIERNGTGRRDIAYLPQAAEIDRTFPVNVGGLVSLGLWHRRGAFGGLGPDDRNGIATALMAVGLDGFAGRQIGTLSGGQLQRALFARVLLQDARLILLDEPFTAIDARTVRDLVDLIRRWHGEGRTVAAVLHDIDLVRETFPDTLLLAREPIAWCATREALCPENLLRARRMQQGWDDHAPHCEAAA